MKNGSIQIQHGEALRLLTKMEDNSVDAIITDPPYSSGGMIRGDRMQDVHTKYTRLDAEEGTKDLAPFTGDTRDSRGYGFWVALWLGEALRVVKPGGVAALFTDWRQLPTTSDALQAGGWVYRGIVPWFKPNGRRTQGRWGNVCEYVVWGTNGPRALDFLGGCALPGFFKATAPSNRDHIAEKPLEVMRELVQIVPPGGVVLDPFLGSGTTAEACLLEGRKCIGFEIDPYYVNIAKQRIEVAQSAPTLFQPIHTAETLVENLT